MGKRAEERNRTRARIVRATMELHDEKGVAPTTFADIAARAGVGQATVSRHFPTLGDIVRACGQHVWQEMRPPLPESAAAVFEGLDRIEQRLKKLVEEVDGFYERGALRLDLAARDREIVPELDGFLCAVEAGVAALVKEALAPIEASERQVETALVLMSFRVWQSFQRSNLPRSELQSVRIGLLCCGLKAGSMTATTGR
ncbi:TetR/AcrR family transcriptional regulator [Nitratireductor sp. GCM10026969]|uniref:TetR/AcrR family transcriptional regulator n=1 Tax=Nitratireductor sp. GCM10026969 TaxID=3252645 RepID=UPI00361D5A64